MSVVSVQIGQYGNQLGSLFLQNHFCNENTENSIYFRKTKAGKWVSRGILLDTEPKPIETAVKVARKTGFNYPAIVRRFGGSSNNWALGYNCDAEFLHDTIDVLRKQCEKCNSIESLLFFASLAGGTGSGLGSHLVEEICDIWTCPIVVQSILPFASGEIATQSLNTILTFNSLFECADAVILADNGLASDLARRIHRVELPTYSDLNTVICSGINRSLALRRSTSSLIQCTTHAHKFFHEFHVPHLAQKALQFDSSTWNGLSSQVERMVVSGTKNPFVIPRNYDQVSVFGNFCVGYGQGSENIGETLKGIHNTRSIMSEYSWGTEKSISCCSSSSSTLIPLKRQLDVAESMFLNSAYLHHYYSHGLCEEIFNSAFCNIEYLLGLYDL
ncbi:hypothetical protein PCE1_004149 [Barthelona sp. PCE]